jgi:hypothetical protein
MKDEAEDRAEGTLPLPLRAAERTDGSELADETDGDDCLPASGDDDKCEGVPVTSRPGSDEWRDSTDEEEVLVRLGKAFRLGRSAL